MATNRWVPVTPDQCDLGEGPETLLGSMLVPLEECVGREEIEEMEEMEEDSTEIGRQRNKERCMEEANCAPGRCPGRPVEEAGRPVRSTGVHGRAHVGAVDRMK